MMLLGQNKQRIYYALQEGSLPIYETDENGEVLYYRDSDGNEIPLETGESQLCYGKAIEFFAPIYMSGGNAPKKEYGVDTSNYDAVLIASKGELPIDETSVIWHTSEVEYTDKYKAYANPNSADYKIDAVKPSLNFIVYGLLKIQK